MNLEKTFDHNQNQGGVTTGSVTCPCCSSRFPLCCSCQALCLRPAGGTVRHQLLLWPRLQRRGLQPLHHVLHPPGRVSAEITRKHKILHLLPVLSSEQSPPLPAALPSQAQQQIHLSPNSLPLLPSLLFPCGDLGGAAFLGLGWWIFRLWSMQCLGVKKTDPKGPIWLLL